ncbi:MAG: hypothetical protein RID42_00305 [Alphaproteobacteria bacterium]
MTNTNPDAGAATPLNSAKGRRFVLWTVLVAAVAFGTLLFVLSAAALGGVFLIMMQL